MRRQFNTLSIVRRKGAGTKPAFRRGSVTLEFALVLPLLVTVMLLCVDFGRFAYVYVSVTNAARAGAGYGAVNRTTPTTRPLWDAGIRKAVEDEMETNPWFDPADLVVASPQLIDEGNGLRRVRVEISYPFQTVINWPFLPGYNDTFQIRGIVVMRAIR